MKKNLFGLAALSVVMLFSACNNNVEPTPQTGEGGLVFEMKFESTEETKAPAITTGIPKTDWSKIAQVQMFLYDASGNVQYSRMLDGLPTGIASKTFTYADVPTGTYTLVLVGNAKNGAAIKTSVSGTVTEWTTGTVTGKGVSNLLIDYPAGTVPVGSAKLAEVAAKLVTTPLQVFMAYATGVTISTDAVTDLSTAPLKLQREVSLMRVRINKTDIDAGGFNNDLVSLKDAKTYLAIQNIGIGGMKIGATTTGGAVVNTAAGTKIYVVSGVNTFSETAPAAADYSNVAKWMDDIDCWGEYVVFSNAARTAAKDAVAATAAQYTITIAGLAPIGYVPSNETAKLTVAKMVYWQGLVPDAFVPNHIREVNVTMLTAGSTIEPDKPVTKGSLKIVVGAPLDWSTGIEKTDVPM